MKRSLLALAVVFLLAAPVYAENQAAIYYLCNGIHDCSTTKTATEGYVCNETGNQGDYSVWSYTVHIPYNDSFVYSNNLAVTGYMGRDTDYTTNTTLGCRGVQAPPPCNACDTAGTNACSAILTNDNTYACCSADFASGVGVYFWNYTCAADACQDYQWYTQMIVLGRRHNSEGGWDGIEENGFTPYLNSYRWQTAPENTELTNNTGWQAMNYAVKSSCSISSGGYIEPSCPQTASWNTGFWDAVEAKIEYANAQARYYEWWWAEYLNVTVNGAVRWYNSSGDFIGTNETGDIGLADFTDNIVTFTSTKPFCVYVNGTGRLWSEPKMGYKNLWDDIGYKVVPLLLSVAADDWVNLSIHSQTSTLEYWGLNVTYENGTCLKCNISSLADGGYMYDHFITTEDSIIAKYYFKKVGYDEWVGTKNYMVHNITAGTFSLFSIFTSQLSNSSIISPFARDMIMIFAITALSVPVGVYSPAGGGFIALIGFGFSAAMGWFSPNLFLLILLALGAAILIMVMGK